MQTEGRVFVVQEPPPTFDRKTKALIAKDLSSAQRYGVVVPILTSSHQSSLMPGPSLFMMQKALRDFNPDQDFLCFAGGDPMSLALAMLALRELNIPDVRVLRWERERNTDGDRTGGGFYTPVVTPLRP